MSNPYSLDAVNINFDNFVKNISTGLELGKVDRQNEFLKLYRANLKSDGTLPSNFQETANAAGFGNEAREVIQKQGVSDWLNTHTDKTTGLIHLTSAAIQDAANRGIAQTAIEAKNEKDVKRSKAASDIAQDEQLLRSLGKRPEQLRPGTPALSGMDALEATLTDTDAAKKLEESGVDPTFAPKDSKIFEWNPSDVTGNKNAQYRERLNNITSATGLSPEDLLKSAYASAAKSAWPKEISTLPPIRSRYVGPTGLKDYNDALNRYEAAKAIAQGAGEKAVLELKQGNFDKAKEYGISLTENEETVIPSRYTKSKGKALVRLRDKTARDTVANLNTNIDFIDQSIIDLDNLKNPTFDDLMLEVPKAARASAMTFNPTGQLSEGNLLEETKKLLSDAWTGDKKSLELMLAGVTAAAASRSGTVLENIENFFKSKQASAEIQTNAPKLRERIGKSLEESRKLSLKKLDSYVIPEFAKSENGKITTIDDPTTDNKPKTEEPKTEEPKTEEAVKPKSVRELLDLKPNEVLKSLSSPSTTYTIENVGRKGVTAVDDKGTEYKVTDNGKNWNLEEILKSSPSSVGLGKGKGKGNKSVKNVHETMAEKYERLVKMTKGKK